MLYPNGVHWSVLLQATQLLCPARSLPLCCCGVLSGRAALLTVHMPPDVNKVQDSRVANRTPRPNNRDVLLQLSVGLGTRRLRKGGMGPYANRITRLSDP